jgi:hypothetical protein
MANRVEVDGFRWEMLPLPEPTTCRYPVATKTVYAGDRGCAEVAVMLGRLTSPDGEVREWPMCPTHGEQWAARHGLDPRM